MPEPVALHFVLDSMLGGVAVSLRKDGCLEYHGYNSDERRAGTIAPPPGDWERLLDELDALGVWDWQERYEALELRTDGPGWQLSVEFPGRPRVFASGYDAFPPHGKSISPEFDRLRAAISAVTGGLPVDFALPEDWAPDELRHFRAATQKLLDELRSPFADLKEAPPVINDLYQRHAAQLDASIAQSRAILRDMLKALG